MAKKKAARPVKKAGLSAKRANRKASAPARRTAKAAKKTRKAAAKSRSAARKKVAKPTRRTAARKAPARKAAARKAAARKAATRKAVARKAAARKPVRKAAARPAPAKTALKAPKAPAAPAAVKVAAPRPAARPAKRPNLDRPRRTVAEIHGVPSSLDMDRQASAVRTGRAEMEQKLHQHTNTSPALTAGDVDADWSAAESSGDEAPGGDNPTPDQDVVDEIGRALGVEYDDDEELQGGDEIAARDRHRWELDPESSDDFEER
jgi:Family of unknown function (DUF6335)